MPLWAYQLSLHNKMLLTKLPANTVVRLSVELLSNEMGVTPKAAFSSVPKGMTPLQAHCNGSHQPCPRQLPLSLVCKCSRSCLDYGCTHTAQQPNRRITCLLFSICIPFLSLARKVKARKVINLTITCILVSFMSWEVILHLSQIP